MERSGIVPALAALTALLGACATTGVPIECQPWECGSNGAWLGNNIVFHELDAAGQPNDARVVLESFEDQWGHPLALDVRRDKLVGTRPNGHEVDGQELVTAGATFWLAHVGASPKEVKQRFKLRIVGYGTTHFWVDPPGATVPVYYFQFSPVEPSCDRLDPKCDRWQNACRPPSGPGHEWGGLEGMAVIFRGDRYVALKKTVKETGGSDSWFNMACAGTTVAKMHLLRHTWASSDDAHVTDEKRRQAVLKMLSADYCGTGQPFTFTGHPLMYTYTQSWQPEAPSPIQWGDAASLDAVWDENGAVCLNVPRLKDVFPQIRPKIVARCGTTHVLKPCSQGLMGELKQGSAQPWSPLGYAISANPQP